MMFNYLKNSSLGRENQVEKISQILSDAWVCDFEGNPHNLSEVLMDCDIKSIAQQLYDAGCCIQNVGEWLCKDTLAFCSVCKIGRDIETNSGWKFCPHCGSKMKYQ